jgi:hypothetical protein
MINQVWANPHSGKLYFLKYRKEDIEKAPKDFSTRGFLPEIG